MSETAKQPFRMRCSLCGTELETHCDTDINATGVHRKYWLQCPKCGATYASDEPAEPVIEVAPGEYERCAEPAHVAPVCSVCRKPIEKVDPHAKWTHVEGMDAIRCQSGELYPQPAVPAQEAPRESVMKSVRHVPGTIHGTNYGPAPNIAIGWLRGVNVPAEPQAGAQVPSQDEPEEVTKLKQELQRVYGLVSHWYKESRRFEDAFDHIKSYAVEAAKTPITRESIAAAPRVDETPSDCTAEAFYNKRGSAGAVVCSCGFAVTYTRLGSDPEKAGMEFFERMHSHRRHLEAELEACKLHELTQYDEMQGLRRRILRESGGGK